MPEKASKAKEKQEMCLTVRHISCCQKKPDQDLSILLFQLLFYLSRLTEEINNVAYPEYESNT